MKALHARRILLTRSQEDNAVWAQRLAELGAEPVQLPCIESEVLASSSGRLARELARSDWLALTSRRAVSAVRELHPGELAQALRIACVGPATAERARELLGRCDLASAGGTGRALAGELAARAPERVLVAGAEETSGELETGLRSHGVVSSTCAVYRTRPAQATSRRDLAALGLDAVVLASPSALRGLSAQVEPAALARLPLVTIGPTTSDAVRAAGLRVAAEARTRDLEGLVEALSSVLSARTFP